MNRNREFKRQESENESTLLTSATYSYKSQIAPRSTVITRRVGAPRAFTQTVYTTSSTVNGVGFGGGVPLKPKSAAVVELQENREKEKRDLVALNDKFASYVERVRFLEVHNKKLTADLDALKGKVGLESGKIREMFEVEIKEAKLIADETKKEKTVADNKAKQASEDAQKFFKRYQEIQKAHEEDKTKISDLECDIANNEAEINLFKRRMGDLDDELKHYKAETQRLVGEIQRVASELDSEVLMRVQLENEKNCLEEELNFLKTKYTQEIDELRQNLILDVGLDGSQFFKSELTNAIREIRTEYEQINTNQQSEMEQWYRLKIQEIQTRVRPDASESIAAREETRKLRTVISEQKRENSNWRTKNAELEARIREMEELIANEKRDGETQIGERNEEIHELRRRTAATLSDHEELLRMKTTLEEEIRTYRSLLEGDGHRDGLKQVVEGIEERARQHMLNSVSGMSTSYSFSVHTTSGGNRFGNTNGGIDTGRFGSVSGTSGTGKLKFIV